MSRLVVVSNRVAAVDEGKQAAGGLAVAVLAALKRTGGIWFGWSGRVTETEESQGEPAIHHAGALTTATLDLSRRDWEDYYNGFANQTLWPLFHYRPGLLSVNRRTRDGYRRVNAWFADRLAPLLRSDDMVWVHDYHLIPFGRELRRLGHHPRLGFFLHTPFPAPEVLMVLPNHRELVEALCAYDLVGFHTATDLRCFLNYIRYEAQGRVDPDGAGWRIAAFGRTLHARAFPISIDTPALAALAQTVARARPAERLRESLVGRKLIIGVDRLDYSKGLPHRFEAFEQLLAEHPEHHNRVSFLQIAPPSREDVPEYAAIRRELSELAGRINGRFAEYDWAPIRYLNKSFGQRMLAGFYRAAHVGLVTPLRDGMNLVAKEYVACQDPQNPGVLVLSQFAGAAQELGEALLVNPFDTEAVGETLHRALTMPLEERRDRHRALMDTLSRNDIGTWRENCVDALSRAPYT